MASKKGLRRPNTWPLYGAPPPPRPLDELLDTVKVDNPDSSRSKTADVSAEVKNEPKTAGRRAERRQTFNNSTRINRLSKNERMLFNDAQFKALKDLVDREDAPLTISPWAEPFINPTQHELAKHKDVPTVAETSADQKSTEILLPSPRGIEEKVRDDRNSTR